jgi:hypothetical protein
MQQYRLTEPATATRQSLNGTAGQALPHSSAGRPWPSLKMLREETRRLNVALPGNRTISRRLLRRRKVFPYAIGRSECFATILQMQVSRLIALL